MAGGFFIPVLKIWFTMLLLSLCFFPVSLSLFRSFSDRGWIQSKVIGLTLAGYASSVLILTRTIPFRGAQLLAVTVILGVVTWAAFFIRNKNSEASAGPDPGTNRTAGRHPVSACFRNADLTLILTEEVLFFVLLAAWCGLYGFESMGALHSEGPMDYGILSSMMRSDTLPPPDMWNCGRLFSTYYYGCHYFTAFLTKLTGSRINEMFTIMTAMVPAASAAIVFSTSWHLVKDRKEHAEKGLSYAAAFLSALLFMCSSNLHYLVYGLFRILPYDRYYYWSLTRYIGYTGDGPGTITEIPAFSFLLGDHHAHIVNIMYVCCFLSILYAWMRTRGRQADLPAAAADGRAVSREILTDPFFWIFGLFITVFFMNNTWDAPIYVFVYVTAAGLLALRSAERGRFLRWFCRCALTAVLLFAASAPFRTGFSTASAGGLIPAQVHTEPGKLLILWGMHLSVAAVFFLYTVCRYRKISTQKGLPAFVRALACPDLFAVMAVFCAVCLILFPELIWIRDFYGGRMNTVFKAYLQSSVLLDTVCVYACIRLSADTKKVPLRVFSAAAAVLFLMSCGYFSFGIVDHYGDITDRSRYRGIDAEHVLDTEMPEDAGAVRWLEENAEGQPHILEAWGREVTMCGRVSSLTGLPTVLGMYHHEQQFTMDPQETERRAGDVDAMYTSDDEELVRHLLKQYDIRYVFVGKEELRKYEVNHAMLRKLGTAVYENESGTYVLEVRG